MINKEQMVDFLQCDISSFNFQDLYDLVISKENCVNCGACLTICPRINFDKNTPKLIDSDPECSLCYKYCPKTFFPKSLFEKEIFKENNNQDSLLGNFQEILAAKSTNNKILQKSQNGGVVTSLLCHAFNSGLIDGVLMVKKDDNWHPKPFIARTQEEIISAAGSIYAMTPLLSVYNEAVHKFKVKNLAFVGLPCQIYSVRKFQLFSPLSDKYGKFKLILGLFCSSNFSYDSISNLVQNFFGISMKDIEKLDVSHGKLISYLKDGSIKQISLERISKYHYPSCKNCKDYSAEFADISIGSVGAPDNKWNSVLIRSNFGKKLFNNAVKHNKIIISYNIDKQKIKNASKRKKLHINKTSDEIYSALKMFDISKDAIEIYKTLLSLGEVDLYTLNEALNIMPEIVSKNLNLLIKRKWILKDNNFYRPLNPSYVIKNEIQEFMRSFNNQINIIKMKFLEDLNILFIKNNLMTLDDIEFVNVIL
ncbi:MAG: Coenzyme F420 hydrogenase/dehydrogenase, beta subunit C-terminal domain [Candidatus Hermodarchaeota archaeon]